MGSLVTARYYSLARDRLMLLLPKPGMSSRQTSIFKKYRTLLEQCTVTVLNVRPVCREALFPQRLHQLGPAPRICDSAAVP